MNTAYGKPDAESLPFDLRHLRWPITYHLADSSAPDKNAQFDKLVETLIEAVRLILSKRSSLTIETAEFVPRKAMKNTALFYDDPKELIAEGSSRVPPSYAVPEGAKAYLRLYPTVAVPPIETELEASSLVASGNLVPMGRIRGYSIQRNTFGAIVYESPTDPRLYHFTQLFLSREIWAIEARFLNAEYRQEQASQMGLPIQINCIASGYLEEYFVKALQNYLRFAQTHLKVSEPLKIEAGLVGIKGYTIAVDDFGGRGNALHDVTQWQGEANYEQPAWEILAPFFNRVWANCGIPRRPQRQAELAKQFENNR